MSLLRSSLVVAFLLAAVLVLGGCSGGTSTGSNTPGGTPTGSGAPGGSGAGATIRITARNLAFEPTAAQAAADIPFTIELDNQDAGVPHDIAIRRGSPTGDQVFRGQEFNGLATRTYEVQALPAGSYAFVCTIHPNMQGTLTVR